MCIGVPGQIQSIDGNQAKVEVCGILRDHQGRYKLPDVGIGRMGHGVVSLSGSTAP